MSEESTDWHLQETGEPLKVTEQKRMQLTTFVLVFVVKKEITGTFYLPVIYV